ncbi:hypothetical protein EZS27_000048 [termite gut metagenome]|uniref:Uncharacterized protein n=1 Tax=termite gut metagenome TaxID=433724 RepID=A0A5J4T282_9ZZZZ
MYYYKYLKKDAKFLLKKLFQKYDLKKVSYVLMPLYTEIQQKVLK